ncbi:hypothetical protein [Enterococcus sp. AZ177]|uniref:hypothetical protein n=1 Tax=unclassified Enterococcus TaxID=2608891 RepID=UPI003D2FF9E6
MNKKYFKNYRITIAILSFLNICVILSTIFWFNQVNTDVMKRVGTGPESGWIFFFIGLPMYFPICISLVVAISLLAFSIMYIFLSIKSKKIIITKKGSGRKMSDSFFDWRLGG